VTRAAPAKRRYVRWPSSGSAFFTAAGKPARPTMNQPISTRYGSAAPPCSTSFIQLRKTLDGLPQGVKPPVTSTRKPTFNIAVQRWAVAADRPLQPVVRQHANDLLLRRKLAGPETKAPLPGNSLRVEVKHRYFASSHQGTSSVSAF
jgi:hypothetical protein